MPTYQYACTACDERLEAVQSFSDAPLTECPACGGALRKVFSAVGVVFKGSGFYKTDSRGSRGGKGDGGEAKGDSKTEAKSDSKSDSSSSTPATSSSGEGSSSTAAAGATSGSSTAGASAAKTPAGKTA